MGSNVSSMGVDKMVQNVTLELANLTTNARLLERFTLVMKLVKRYVALVKNVKAFHSNIHYSVYTCACFPPSN